MAKTAGEIEIEMGAATSNVQSGPTQLRLVLCVDLGGTGDGSGTKSISGNVAGTAGGKRRNWNQAFGLEH
jgi:hypothetical protein